MCNFCNTCCNNGRSGCGCGSCGCNSYCNNGSLWGWGRQLLCRDCNGNIWVNQRNTCGCNHNRCGCNHNGCGSCGCNGNAATTTTNGNGGYLTCVTFCGNNGLTTTSGNSDLYYARQYGLYPFGYNRGCGCSLDAVSEL